MKPIQKGRTGQALAEEFGLKGRTSPQIDETVVPTAQLLDIADGPNRLPRKAIGQDFSAAGAGAFSFVGVEAPTGKLILVRAVRIRNAGAAVLGVNLKADVPGLALARNRSAMLYFDGRGQGSPTMTYDASNAVSLGVNVEIIQIPANSTYDWIPSTPVVLLGPDGRITGAASGLMVSPTANNTAVSASFEIDEYELPG